MTPLRFQRNAERIGLTGPDILLLWNALPEAERVRRESRVAIQLDDRRYAAGHLEFKSRRPRTRRRAVRSAPIAVDRCQADDPLKALTFEQYAPILAPDCEPSRGKCHCPAPGHDDSHPSCSYKDNLWHCFSCLESGDIYSLGSLISGLDTRRDFPELRRWLADRLLGAAA